MALAAYRHILRSARIAFQGDAHTLLSARQAVREGFESKRSITDTKEIEEAIEYGRQVGTILQQNVVQGKMNDQGRYKLNIHEHTERGDNDTIKNPPPIIRGKRNTLKNVKASSL